MFSFPFCVLRVRIVLCIASPLAYNCLFSTRTQVYWLLPPGGNRIALHKYRIISHNSRICVYIIHNSTLRRYSRVINILHSYRKVSNICTLFSLSEPKQWPYDFTSPLQKQNSVATHRPCNKKTQLLTNAEYVHSCLTPNRQSWSEYCTQLCILPHKVHAAHLL